MGTAADAGRRIAIKRRYQSSISWICYALFFIYSFDQSPDIYAPTFRVMNGKPMEPNKILSPAENQYEFSCAILSSYNLRIFAENSR